MRVISGTAKGRALHSPRDARVRPTADRVKEALFSILSSCLGKFDKLKVLDIFAGAGSLGIEALSRGADSAIFLDNHRESVALIRKNLQATRLQERAGIIVRESTQGLIELERAGRCFDLVFLDPPYRMGLVDSTLEFLATSSLLHSDSIVVAEFGSREETGSSFGKLQEFDRRIYGDTALSFLKLQAEE